MEVVGIWTGRRANALQHAMRLTNEGFAARLGTAVRTVAKWSAQPDLVPVVEIQRALDSLLYQAPDDVKARFAILSVETASEPTSAMPQPGNGVAEAEARLAVDRH